MLLHPARHRATAVTSKQAEETDILLNDVARHCIYQEIGVSQDETCEGLQSLRLSVRHSRLLIASQQQSLLYRCVN